MRERLARLSSRVVPQRRAAVIALVLAVLSTGSARAIVSPFPRSESTPQLVVLADRDDDDDDGVTDAEQASAIPEDDLVALDVEVPRGDRFALVVEGPIRIVRNGAPLAPSTLRAGTHHLFVQGLRASEPSADGRVLLRSVVEHPAVTERSGVIEREVARVTVVSLSLLDGANRTIVPSRDALAVSMRIPNDETLPRRFELGGTSDARDVRIEIDDPRVELDQIEASIESVDATGVRRHAQEHVTLRREVAGGPYRSAFLRLVATELDAAAPGVTDRVLRVALGDRVRIVYAGLTHDGVRVGRPSAEDHPRAIRRGTLRVRIVRNAAGVIPPIGGTDVVAIAMAREQIQIANEIWSQCAIEFGAPADADVEVIDPPPPSLVAIADVDGLPAAGGTIRLVVDGHAISIVATAGARPVDTALALAAAMRRAGLRPRVLENERVETGADRSADVLVRRRDGVLARVTRDGDVPLTTDPQQTVAIGVVELGDGLTEFDNMTALTGTLEERALIRAVGDDDDRTIDVLIVGELAGRTREGEAFIEGESAGAPGSIVNTVILSREGIARARTAFTLAHELGHVLLDHPLHPDHLGADRPWLLMDSDTSEGSILAPRRLTEDECARARARSGPDAIPPLLERARATRPRLARPRPTGTAITRTRRSARR